MLRHSKISTPSRKPFGAAELVPAGCFLWSPRLLSQGTGDKLIVHCDPWSLARADTVSAVGRRWSHPGPDLATEPGTLVDLVGPDRGHRFRLVTRGSLVVAASGPTTRSGRL